MKKKTTKYKYVGCDDEAVKWQICHDIINMLRHTAGIELSTAVSPYNCTVYRCSSEKLQKERQLYNKSVRRHGNK